MQEQDFVIRPLNSGDLNWLLEAAALAGPGFTSLANNKEYIESRLDQVIKSFAGQIPIQKRIYIFVRENYPDKQRVGISGLQASIGYDEEFYSYQISHVVQSYKKLNITASHRLLHVVNNFQDASELISFWVHPDYRGKNNSRYLSLCRLLFIAQHRDLFENKVVAEIRGVSDDAGVSPFWDAVGRHFFHMDFVTADSLTSLGKDYIAELVSREPIYVDLLPESAQAVIGVENKKASPARHVLESEGFRCNNHVDIFDAGPLLDINTADIRTIKNSKSCIIATVSDAIENGTKALIYNCNAEQPRFTRSYILLDSNGDAILSEHAAQQLNLKIGNTIRYVLITKG